MNSLLGYGGAGGISRCECALNHGRAKRNTRDCGCGMWRFVQRSGGLSGSGLPVDGIAGKRGDRIVLMRVSPSQSRFLRGHFFGPMRRPAAGSLFCFAGAPCGLRFPSATDPP